jgi:hypothetical protein
MKYNNYLWILGLFCLAILLPGCTPQRQFIETPQEKTAETTILCGPFPGYKDDGVEINISSDLNESELKELIFKNTYHEAFVYFDYNYDVDPDDFNTRREFDCIGENITIRCGYKGNMSSSCKYI